MMTGLLVMMLMMDNHSYLPDTILRPSHESPHLIALQHEAVDTTLLILLIKELRPRGGLVQSQTANATPGIIKEEVWLPSLFAQPLLWNRFVPKGSINK